MPAMNCCDHSEEQHNTLKQITAADEVVKSEVNGFESFVGKWIEGCDHCDCKSGVAVAFPPQWCATEPTRVWMIVNFDLGGNYTAKEYADQLYEDWPEHYHLRGRQDSTTD